MLYCGNYLMFVRDQNHLDKIMDRIEREVERYKHQIGMIELNLFLFKKKFNLFSLSLSL